MRKEMLNCSPMELIAMATGRRGAAAIVDAHRLLEKVGLKKLSDAGTAEIQAVCKGMTNDAVTRLMAGVEIGLRIAELKGEYESSTRIFPEIKQALEDLLPITGDSEFVLGRRLKTKNNWGTPLMKMVVRAGIPSWSAVFNSLRASGEIDIARTYGLQCATEWVGNSVQVALKHYVRSTDADFERASNPIPNFGPLGGPEPARSNANQDELVRSVVQSSESANPEELKKPNKKRAFGENSEARSMVPTGLEPKFATGCSGNDLRQVA